MTKTEMETKAEGVMETTEATERTSKMWAALGDQIADLLPNLVIEGDPVKAIQWATCAEACFWKATGEADAHDVKDILPPRGAQDL